MKVFNPVRVAAGISGRPSALLCCSRRLYGVQKFKLILGIRHHSLVARGRWLMTAERNATKQTMMTAIQDSTWCQSITQTMSSVVPSLARIPDIRTAAIMTMTRLKHKKSSRPNFWRILKLTLYRSQTGIAITVLFSAKITWLVECVGHTHDIGQYVQTYANITDCIGFWDRTAY